jgi:hypothetical protein
LIREDEFGHHTELCITSERAKASADRSDLQVAVKGDAMSEIQEMLANANRVEVSIVLFRDDFDRLEMEPELDAKVADLDDCWRVEPKPGWTVVADDQGNMSVDAPERYEAPAGWRWVATLALLLVPERGSSDQAKCRGYGLWFAMAGVHPPPHLEAFFEYLRDEMLRRVKIKAEQWQNSGGTN